ncbi:3-dehydroquinate synthase [Acidobacteriia bacterium AH_259_A11_L15]|nr:3-dehydroquinate synthase [Acidobacteriia bacterium AH_259_A11_L15]
MKSRTKANPSVATVWVRTASARYPVWVGSGLLRQAGRRLQRLRPGCRRLFVVSSPRVWALWGKELGRGLRAAGVPLEPLLMDDREEKKRLATVEKLAEELLRRGADRGDLLAALGGGVVGDVAGFLAASYMRGVDYVQIPTTLVGQMDSAIGGKTGVNLRGGKNLVGAFHQPRAVLVDPRTLNSLRGRDYRAGLYEVVKCAVIGDPALFRFLEENLEAVLGRQSAALASILLRSIRLKARIVTRDEREQNLRRVLNFGHTFGHALEAVTGYRRLRHGEAVAWGMIAATRLAERLGRVPPADAGRIIALVQSVGRLPALPRVRPERVYARLAADKKRRGGALHFVLPRRIGRVEIRAGLPPAAVRASLRELDPPRAAR